jgi:mannose-6-phosphate isomerase-like protein (cupin superfamily)
MTATTTTKHSLKGTDKKEAFHREAESRVETYSFKPPAKTDSDGPKTFYYLAGTDLVKGSVQVVPKGGDNNLHYHPGVDGFWMVLQGKVRFYGPDGVIGEYGKNEGILVPRNARYWFETADTTEDLHLLHVTGSNQQKVANSRVNIEAVKKTYTKSIKIGYPKGAKAD